MYILVSQAIDNDNNDKERKCRLKQKDERKMLVSQVFDNDHNDNDEEGTDLSKKMKETVRCSHKDERNSRRCEHYPCLSVKSVITIKMTTIKKEQTETKREKQ